MQSVGDTIRVFPCWPSDQNATFKDLRAAWAQSSRSSQSSPLTRAPNHTTLRCDHFGGVLVSTWETRQRRHAEDGSLASLNIGPKINS